MNNTRENVFAISQYVGGRLREVIQDGFPEVGWSGDPLLVPAWNPRNEEWLILDRATNPPTIVMRKPWTGLGDLNFRDLCERLRNAQVKGQGAQTIEQRRLARNQAIEDENAKELSDLNIAVARELYDTSRHRKTYVL